MTYLTPDFWEHNPQKRQKAQDAALQNDRHFLIANRQIDFDILQAEKTLSQKDSSLRDDTFKLWKAKKGYM